MLRSISSCPGCLQPSIEAKTFFSSHFIFLVSDPRTVLLSAPSTPHIPAGSLVWIGARRMITTSSPDPMTWSSSCGMCEATRRHSLTSKDMRIEFCAVIGQKPSTSSVVAPTMDSKYLTVTWSRKMNWMHTQSHFLWIMKINPVQIILRKCSFFSVFNLANHQPI